MCDGGELRLALAASVFARRHVGVDTPDPAYRSGARTSIRIDGLSAHTGYLRLLSGRQPTSVELERWTDIDPAREIAIIAVTTEDGTEQQIGVARCILDDEDPTRWDFAVVVGDAWQGKGLGETLLRLLIQCAEESGVPALSSVTSSENQHMLSLARRLGFTARREPGGASVMRIERRLRAWTE